MDDPKTLILDPTGMRKPSEVRLAPRPEDLKGLTVGLLDNGAWVTWEMICRRYAGLLKEHHGVREVIYLNQIRLGEEKGIDKKQAFEDLASKCDVAIAGLGN